MAVSVHHLRAVLRINSRIDGEVPSMNIVDKTVMVVIYAVTRYLAGVCPYIVVNIGVVIIYARIYDSHRDACARGELPGLLHIVFIFIREKAINCLMLWISGPNNSQIMQSPHIIHITICITPYSLRRIIWVVRGRWKWSYGLGRNGLGR